MRMSPRYVGPTIHLARRRGDVGELFVRQRRRLDATFRSLSDCDDWRAPTRCENWTVQTLLPTWTA